MKLKDVKIVFIDIDGTLVNDNKEITESTKQSIKRVVDMGIHVVITSGRDLPHTIQRAQNANASSIVIATGGSLIYDYSNDKIIFKDLFNEKQITQIWKYCTDNKTGIMLKEKDAVYYNEYSCDKTGFKYQLLTDINKCSNFKVSQFLVSSDKIEKIDNIREYAKKNNMFVTSFSSSYANKTISDVYDIDLNNSSVNKGTGIKKVLEYLDIKKENSLCIGDYYNDIDMFKECGITVAMGNAVDEIKKVSDYVTDSNNENGVATFLNKYL